MNRLARAAARTLAPKTGAAGALRGRWAKSSANALLPLAAGGACKIGLGAPSPNKGGGGEPLATPRKFNNTPPLPHTHTPPLCELTTTGKPTWCGGEMGAPGFRNTLTNGSGGPQVLAGAATPQAHTPKVRKHKAQGRYAHDPAACAQTKRCTSQQEMHTSYKHITHKQLHDDPLRDHRTKRTAELGTTPLPGLRSAQPSNHINTKTCPLGA